MSTDSFSARQQFGNLQHRTFPIYFSISIALSSSLLALWSLNHSTVLAFPLRVDIGDVAQAWALGAVLLAQVANQFVIGPLTSQYV